MVLGKGCLRAGSVDSWRPRKFVGKHKSQTLPAHGFLVPARSWSPARLPAVDDTAVRQSLDAWASARPVGGEAGLDGRRRRRGSRHHSRGGDLAPRNEFRLRCLVDRPEDEHAGKCQRKNANYYWLDLLLHQKLPSGGSTTAEWAGFLLGWTYARLIVASINY